jgi:hypothetical protein
VKSASGDGIIAGRGGVAASGGGIKTGRGGVAAGGEVGL